MENNIVRIENTNGKLVVSSRVVAEQLGKRHGDVLIKIKEVCNEREFSLVEYNDKKGELRPEALLTKDGFILLCMNYTGYNDFKRAYINKFNEIEEKLNNPLAKFDGMSKWDLIIAYAQMEKDKEVAMLEMKAKQDIINRASESLMDISQDTSRGNLNMLIKSLVADYCKEHNINTGVGIGNAYSTVYKDFCNAYGIDCSEVIENRKKIGKKGQILKTKKSMIEALEDMGLSSKLLEYVKNVKVRDIL